MARDGAFDPAEEICARAREAGAWVHVDGAFGLWAAVSPHYAPLLAGVGAADSWAIDCHKWLNVPYDSGVAVVRDAEPLRRTMTLSAAYLTPGDGREPGRYAPEGSRRARGVDLWAAMRSLGRSGLREMIERNCRQAKMFAERLRAAGFSILNDVVLNQVLVSFGSPAETRRVIAAIQTDGTCWCGGTEWQGHTAMRISVSCWATTDEDVERSAAAMIRIANAGKS
jgi:glutamate/tyrosine decarboxylase-like PLP-dependent enzyme